MLLMSKESKEALTVLIVTVMLLMSKESKEALTVLFITSLIFNGFSIRKKFWKAETETFPTIPPNAMYVEACQRGQKSK